MRKDKVTKLRSKWLITPYFFLFLLEFTENPPLIEPGKNRYEVNNSILKLVLTTPEKNYMLMNVVD